MASGETYKYPPLVEPHDFRLFVLRPSPHITAPVQGELISAALADYYVDVVAHYTALSYVWGDENDQQQIEIDGTPVQITASLASALRHVRDPSRAMAVWADGICINQRDVREKNTQVRQMGMIYEAALHTIIFLGDSDPKSRSLIDQLSIVSRYDQRRAARLLEGSNQSGPPMEQSRDLEIQTLVLEHILQKPWFSRVWVLQELVLSANPWVQVGTSRLRWNVFYSLLIQLSTPRPTHGPLKRFFDIHHARVTLGPTWLPIANGKSKSDNLLELLRWRRGAGVTNPRDMIYAHLGMLGGTNDSRDAVEKYLSVDYEKSVGEVYTDAALYFIESKGGFGILSHVEDVRPENRRQGLPSWVPDWTSAQLPPDVDTHAKEYRPLSDFGLLYKPFTRTGVLGTIGYVIGVIKTIREDFPPVFDLETLKESASPSVAKMTPQGVRFEIPKDFKSIEQVLVTHLQDWLGAQFQQPFQGARSGSDSRWITHTGTVVVGKPTADFAKGPIQVKILLDSRKPLPPVLPMTNTVNLWRDGRYWTLGYLLMGMVDKTGVGLFSGRKIAFLEDGSLAFIPKFAAVGDTVCRFNASPVTYLLRGLGTDAGLGLRKEPQLEAEILEFFEKNKEMVLVQKEQDVVGDKGPLFDGKELLRNLDTSRAHHFTFLGECIHDPWEAVINKPSPNILVLH